MDSERSDDSVRANQRLNKVRDELEQRAAAEAAARKSFENRANSTNNQQKIDKKGRPISTTKSMKTHSCAVFGTQSYFGDARECARDGSGTPKEARTNLGAPWASQECPGTIQKRPWAGPETLPDGSGTAAKRA